MSSGAEAAAGDPSPTYAAAREAARERVRQIRGFYLNAISYAIVMPGLWLINFLSTPNIWWAQWPTLGWGLGLAAQAFGIYASKTYFGQEWEERKVADLMAREDLRIVSGEKALIDAQLRLLQAQIEPHFLFNTLANVQSLIHRSPAEASNMLDRFIGYLRRTLSASRAQSGTLQQEFDLLRDYLEIIALRMGSRLRVTLALPPELAQEPLAPMLLQPLVENAIKHGLEPKVEGGEVSVVARAQGDELLITITDNGLGFAAQAGTAGTGVGLAHTQERLAMLYDGRARLEVADAQPGTRVTLTLPKSVPTQTILSLASVA